MKSLCMRSIWILFALALASPAHAQEAEPARSSAYFELLGNGIFYTLNYDRKFSEHVSGRIGLMALGATAVPVMANYLAGSGNHRLELGAGPVLFYLPDTADLDIDEEDIEQGFGAYATATFGYRYQPVDGGFVFRIGITPLLTSGGALPWPGISFGYAF